MGSYSYSQTRIEASTDKRADCTGWLSYVWATPNAGPGIYLHAYNTASFVTQNVITRIGWAELLPGDMVGYCSPTSPGNGGHAAVWMDGDKRPDGTFDVSDHGSGWGPKRRWVRWDGQSTGWLHPDHLAPWRYVGLIETEGDDMTKDELLAALRDPNDPLARQLKAVPWQYVGGGIPAGMSTLGVLDLIRATVQDIAAKVATGPEDRAALGAAVAELKVLLTELVDADHPAQADSETIARLADLATRLDAIPTAVGAELAGRLAE